MSQIPVDDARIAPGQVWEWQVILSAEGKPARLGYNQIRHTAAARRARAAGGRLVFTIAATFDLPGPNDLDALDAALRRFVRRHEALRARYNGLTCAVLDPDDVELERTTGPRLVTSAQVRAYLRRRFRQVDTLDGPWLALGAITRDDSTTVYLAFDHLVADTMSAIVAVTDIAMDYEGHEPAEPGDGYLTFSQEQHRQHSRLRADDPRLRVWEEFSAGEGGLFPPFPLDLGVPPGQVFPPVNKSVTLMNARETGALEARCHESGAGLSLGVLAAVAVSQRNAGGPGIHRNLMLVNERKAGRATGSVGWFVNVLPITVPVPPGSNSTDMLTRTRQAYERARDHNEIHYLRAWDLLDPNGDHPSSYWPYPVNLFSYLDVRNTPCEPNIHHVTSASDGILSWFVRDTTGLHLNVIHARTTQAKCVTTGLIQSLRATLFAMKRNGPLTHDQAVKV
ncbi:condensation domain-containing protein [Amycolatopsis speibonae]|uniref:Condensation domain-containing protein n=1 Tax=Amycolatopsis speibonae TaxID=1450224 RepID=A0ABV7NYH1_9PSEU